MKSKALGPPWSKPQVIPPMYQGYCPRGRGQGPGLSNISPSTGLGQGHRSTFTAPCAVSRTTCMQGNTSNHAPIQLISLRFNYTHFQLHHTPTYINRAYHIYSSESCFSSFPYIYRLRKTFTDLAISNFRHYTLYMVHGTHLLIVQCISNFHHSDSLNCLLSYK